MCYYHVWAQQWWERRVSSFDNCNVIQIDTRWKAPSLLEPWHQSLPASVSTIHLGIFSFVVWCLLQLPSYDKGDGKHFKHLMSSVSIFTYYIKICPNLFIWLHRSKHKIEITHPSHTERFLFVSLSPSSSARWWQLKYATRTATGKSLNRAQMSSASLS